MTPQAIETPGELVVGDEATVFVLDAASRARFTAEHLRRFVDAGGGIVAIGTEEEHDVPAELREELLSAFLRHPYGPRQLLLALRTGYREAAARADSVRSRLEAATRAREINELTRIGMALTTERDYGTLQDLILSQARQLSSSDAGSLYLVETLQNGERQLRFKLLQNHSRPDIPLVEFTIPIDKSSVAGYVATTGEPLLIDDAYSLPRESEYTINRSIDTRYGYRTKSMLTIPMTDHKNEVIGVLQLINRKRDFRAQLKDRADFEAQVIPYSRRVVELSTALASQAAVSIENSQLYEEIERLFEGFVRASIHAVEQRDPTTFGHSSRVADKTVGLAEVVDRVDQGPYRDVTFTRQDMRAIEYAGLLHDFGKVGVKEHMLVKAKKLYPHALTQVKQRHAFIRRTVEAKFYQQLVEYVESGRGGYEDFKKALVREHERQVKELDLFMQIVLESNEPTVLPEGTFGALLDHAARYYEDLEGKQQPYLTQQEVQYLTIRKGSLDQEERKQIERHVEHTYDFLSKIPWTTELRSIPHIARGHHEKLDGSGYPRQLRGVEQIPIQTRMMTITDIYDALTAADRPYKSKLSPDRALQIMEHEVAEGQLDQPLFRLFVEAEVFKRQK